MIRNDSARMRGAALAEHWPCNAGSSMRPTRATPNCSSAVLKLIPRTAGTVWLTRADHDQTKKRKTKAHKSSLLETISLRESHLCCSSRQEGAPLLKPARRSNAKRWRLQSAGRLAWVHHRQSGGTPNSRQPGSTVCIRLFLIGFGSQVS